MREISLQDTRTGERLPLRPREGNKVGIYACGPTVYDRIHVGNARPFVVFSLLKRFLRHEGYDVTHVANITDVNDKIYAAAAASEPPLPSVELAATMAAHYRADTDALGLGRPDHEPLASETIGDQIELIEALIERGAAYAAQGDVYFRVRADPGYGSLSHRDVDQMDDGDGGEETARKEDPLDFALWKAHKPGEDSAWDAPWGRGRPGWHIECSAMAEAALGLNFEIHGGGNDLAFPHHENEAAQTRAGRGQELAQIWMHNGMLQFGGEKMAKSIGNVAPLHAVIDSAGRDALILLFCSAHYRGPLSFTDETVAQAQAGVRRIRELSRSLVQAESPAQLGPLKERFFSALADDYNTPDALAVVWEWVREANKADAPVGGADLAEMLEVLGLENLLAGGEDSAPDDVVALAQARVTARENKDFQESDRLRDEIDARGFVVRDSPDGFELVPK
ncbi:MAG TPA: cysteine--tRNA ligase [Baekduia sp.]|nr:cysteine--tRNA ligase [Baekduia sp.]